ncbi:MAG TPA: hypothetical protein VFB31_10255 [Pseudolabrys sp.]|nr:hypothetical protein [Pseudolabrys sp.]
MVEVFPKMTATVVDKAKPGSILKIPRSSGVLIGLVTNEVSDNGARSVVLLNSMMSDRPPVIFARKWRFATALCFDDPGEFELKVDDKHIDWRNSRRWETSGCIIVADNQLFIRAALADEMAGGHEYVNIQTGSLYSGTMPGDVPAICGWSLRIPDKKKHRHIPLCSFDAPVEQ